MDSSANPDPQQDDSASRLDISIRSITLSDGTNVEIPRGGVVLFVGPNNAGKSRALRDIYQQLNQHSSERPVVTTHIEVDRRGDETAIREWLAEHAFPAPAVGQPEVTYLRNGAGVVPSHAVQYFLTGPPFQGLGPMLVFLATAEQRLNLVASSPSHDPFTQPPSTPLQVLYARDDLARRLSDAAYDAFGTHLTVNRAAGPNLHLHVGTTDEEPSPTNPAYITALQSLPHLHEQGDGMKSLIGLMLGLVNPGHQLVLVDEPEAFLHPPQARLLGRLLAKNHPEGVQLFVATHSTDVVQGFLDASTDVTVVRLERAGSVNCAAVLVPERVRELGRDPLLRYSEILEGLFHTGVVLCEGDSDCRFYQGTLDATLDRAGERPHDLLFTHCGGKHRMANVVKALRAVDVPVRVIADIDVLNESGNLRSLVEALGGEWSELESDWRLLDTHVRQLARPPLLSTVREEVVQAFAQTTEHHLSPAFAERLRGLTKPESGWSRVRAGGGYHAFPPGEATQAGARLLAALAEVGLFVVPLGELESWAKEVGGHGPVWATRAFEQRVHERDGEHANFILSVARSLEGDPSGAGR